MRLFGHSVHQMLVPFPIGLLTVSFLFDLVYLATGTPRWADIAFWLITGGIISALAAAFFGVIDWSRIPRGTRAHRVGLLHGAGNGVLTVLFLISWFMRVDHPVAPSIGAIILSGLAVALSLVTAWLGGELVAQHGVGVNDDADLDAPSSLADDHRGRGQRPWGRGADPVRP